MTKARKSGKKGRKTRRPTKAEQEKQKAFRRMLIAFGTAFVLFFAIIRLGAFGVTVYNVIRFEIGRAHV